MIRTPRNKHKVRRPSIHPRSPIKKKFVSPTAVNLEESPPTDHQRYIHFKKMEFFLKPYYKEYYNQKEHMEFSQDDQFSRRNRVLGEEQTEKQNGDCSDSDQIVPNFQNSPKQLSFKKLSNVNNWKKSSSKVNLLKRKANTRRIDQFDPSSRFNSENTPMQNIALYPDQSSASLSKSTFYKYTGGTHQNIDASIDSRIIDLGSNIVTTNPNEFLQDQNWGKVASFILNGAGGEFQKKLKAFKQMKADQIRRQKLREDRQRKAKQQAAVKFQGMIRARRKSISPIRGGALFSVVNATEQMLEDTHKTTSNYSPTAANFTLGSKSVYNSIERFKLPKDFISKKIDVYSKINKMIDKQIDTQNSYGVVKPSKRLLRPKSSYSQTTSSNFKIPFSQDTDDFSSRIDHLYGSSGKNFRSYQQCDPFKTSISKPSSTYNSQTKLQPVPSNYLQKEIVLEVDESLKYRTAQPTPIRALQTQEEQDSKMLPIDDDAGQFPLDNDYFYEQANKKMSLRQQLESNKYQNRPKMSCQKLAQSIASKSLRKMVPMLTEFAVNNSNITLSQWVKLIKKQRQKKKLKKLAKQASLQHKVPIGLTSSSLIQPYLSSQKQLSSLVRQSSQSIYKTTTSKTNPPPQPPHAKNSQTSKQYTRNPKSIKKLKRCIDHDKGGGLSTTYYEISRNNRMNRKIAQKMNNKLVIYKAFNERLPNQQQKLYTSVKRSIDSKKLLHALSPPPLSSATSNNNKSNKIKIMERVSQIRKKNKLDQNYSSGILAKSGKSFEV